MMKHMSKELERDHRSVAEACDETLSHEAHRCYKTCFLSDSCIEEDESRFELLTSD